MDLIFQVLLLAFMIGTPVLILLAVLDWAIWRLREPWMRDE